MKLVVSPLAVRRLAEIGHYLADRSPAAALRVEAGIRATFALLQEHPMAGRSLRDGLRRLAVPRLRYVVLYRFDETTGTVTIATIRHTSQRPIRTTTKA